MSLSRRLLVLSSALWPLARPRVAVAADPSAAPALVQRFYDELLAVMKEAKRLSFDQRYSRLAPAVLRRRAASSLDRPSGAEVDNRASTSADGSVCQASVTCRWPLRPWSRPRR